MDGLSNLGGLNGGVGIQIPIRRNLRLAAAIFSQTIHLHEIHDINYLKTTAKLERREQKYRPKKSARPVRSVDIVTARALLGTAKFYRNPQDTQVHPTG
jgi:hypothetical protein